MSVLLKPARVTKMQTAPIVMALLAVIVNRDLLEMAQPAKACFNIWKYENL